MEDLILKMITFTISGYVTYMLYRLYKAFPFEHCINWCLGFGFQDLRTNQKET